MIDGEDALRETEGDVVELVSPLTGGIGRLGFHGAQPSKRISRTVRS
jgi:hypothetical protein